MCQWERPYPVWWLRTWLGILQIDFGKVLSVHRGNQLLAAQFTGAFRTLAEASGALGVHFAPDRQSNGESEARFDPFRSHSLPIRNAIHKAFFPGWIPSVSHQHEHLHTFVYNITATRTNLSKTINVNEWYSRFTYIYIYPAEPMPKIFVGFFGLFLRWFCGFFVSNGITRQVV